MIVEHDGPCTPETCPVVQVQFLTGQRDALALRVRELEAGLREYGHHSASCQIAREDRGHWLLTGQYRGEPDVVWSCSCGLAALAGGEGDPK